MKNIKRRIDKIENQVERPTKKSCGYGFILGGPYVCGNRLYDRPEDIPESELSWPPHSDGEEIFELPVLCNQLSLGDRFLIEGKIYERLEDFPHPHGKPGGIVFQPIWDHQDRKSRDGN